MPRIIKPLNSTQIDKAKPKEKEYTLADGGGLYLRLLPTGAKLWVFNYYQPLTKKRVKTSFGSFPEISLAMARAKREEYRALIAQGIDPQEQRKEQQQVIQQQIENTFYKWAERWKENKQKKVLEKTIQKDWRRLEMYLFERIGQEPIDKILPQVLIQALTPLEAMKDRRTGKADSDTLKRVIRLTNEILTYAMNAGAIAFNPCLGVKSVYNFAPAENHPHIAPDELDKLLIDIHHAKSLPITKDLILFQLLTMVRPAEASSAEWSEIDLDKKTWTIPAKKMKMRNPHRVPLSSQVLKILERLQAQTGHKQFVFDSPMGTNKPMSSQTVNKALVDMGYKGKQDAHGLRSIGRTFLSEQRIDFEVAEMCISHKVGNSTSRIYDKADFFEQRISVMQQWGDYVEKCESSLYKKD